MLMNLRSSGNLILHPEHGLNPSMYNCFLCGEEMGLILPGAHVGKFKQAGLCESDGRMHRSIGCIDKEPCDKCKGSHIDKGYRNIALT